MNQQPSTQQGRESEAARANLAFAAAEAAKLSDEFEEKAAAQVRLAREIRMALHRMHGYALVLGLDVPPPFTTPDR